MKMSALVKEALVSTKADVIKEARKNEKGQVTRKVDQILTILKQRWNLGPMIIIQSLR